VKNKSQRVKHMLTGIAETSVRAIKSQRMFKGTYKMHLRLKESKEFWIYSWIYQKSPRIVT
jgi:hypothetical protein